MAMKARRRMADQLAAGEITEDEYELWKARFTYQEMGMDIKRITIKGESGCGPLDEAHTDRLTLTPDSISYEYKPHPESELESNIYRKWTYKTTSPIFKHLYRQAAGMAPRFLHDDEVVFANDVESTEIIATFEDGHREKRSFICPSEYFEEWFAVIKRMVPGCEYVPAVLLTEQDYEDAG